VIYVILVLWFICGLGSLTLYWKLFRGASWYDGICHMILGPLLLLAYSCIEISYLRKGDWS